jgi:hypothetical protein
MRSNPMPHANFDIAVIGLTSTAPGQTEGVSDTYGLRSESSERSTMSSMDKLEASRSSTRSIATVDGIEGRPTHPLPRMVLNRRAPIRYRDYSDAVALSSGSVPRRGRHRHTSSTIRGSGWVVFAAVTAERAPSLPQPCSSEQSMHNSCQRRRAGHSDGDPD